MIASLIVGALVALVAVISWTLLHMRSRQQITALEAAAAPGLDTAIDELGLPEPPPTLPTFKNHLAVLTDLLPNDSQSRLHEALAAAVNAERSYFPGHKAGGTISYASLLGRSPAAVAFYRSPFLHDLVSRIVGEPVKPTPLWDQSSCSLLSYDESGDHIGWHYDYNFYRGRHFTILYIVENRGDENLSSAKLQIRDNGEVLDVPTPSNALVVFEGRHVFHRVTRLGPNERRLVLSMTLTTNGSSSLLQSVMRRFKDTAYYGPRALWT